MWMICGGESIRCYRRSGSSPALSPAGPCRPWRWRRGADTSEGSAESPGARQDAQESVLAVGEPTVRVRHRLRGGVGAPHRREHEHPAGPAVLADVWLDPDRAPVALRHVRAASGRGVRTARPPALAVSHSDPDRPVDLGHRPDLSVSEREHPCARNGQMVGRADRRRRVLERALVQRRAGEPLVVVRRRSRLETP
jgi:hypothetical protein